jgi:phage terminase small subunit
MTKQKKPARAKAPKQPPKPRKKNARSDKLSLPHEKFCEHYALHKIGAQAIRYAYPQTKAKSDQYVAERGSVLLATPKIRTRIDELSAQVLNRANEKYGITADRVLQELAAIGFSDMRDLTSWGETVVVVDEQTGDVRTVNAIMASDSKSISDQAAKAIKSIGTDKDGNIKFTLHDKRAALVDLGKHLGVFKEPEQGGITINISEAMAEGLVRAKARRIAVLPKAEPA